MATVTGVTKQHADSIEDQIISEAARQGTSLVFTTKGGTVFSIDNAFPLPFESYAIGQILMTDRSANPATYLGGGTWIRWGKGRVPVGVDEADAQFDGVEELGGYKTHTLSVTEMPSHDHGANTGYQSHDHTHVGSTSSDGLHSHNYSVRGSASPIGGGNMTASNYTLVNAVTDSQGTHFHSFGTSGVSTNHYHSITAEGGNQPHNNLQPYITVYMWKRTA